MLQACLRAFTRDDVIIDYVVNGKAGKAYHSSKLETFPEYLWIQMKRFTVGSDWMPRKLDVDIAVPDELDLGFMRAAGLQPGEVEMRDDDVATVPTAAMATRVATEPVEVNADFVGQLLAIGFPENACRKAVYYTRQEATVDAATNWLMFHIGEPDFDELPAALLGQSVTSAVDDAGLAGAGADAEMPDEADVQMLMNMGFSRNQATVALQQVEGLERAADWAFNHLDELAGLDETVAMASTTTVVGAGPASGGGVPMRCSDGRGKYSLVALISHIGTNIHVGHYVSHIRQTDGSWALFNDDKVQRSVAPPKQFAYLYLYKRDC